MQVWNVLHAAHWKYSSLRKKLLKNRHLGTIAQICPAISSQLRHVSTIGKQLLKSNVSSRCPHTIVNFGPLMAEICWRVWSTPANFNWFRVLAWLLHRRRSTVVKKTLQNCSRLLGCYTIYTFLGLLPLNRILPGAKFTLHPRLAFSYIGSVTAWHSSSGRQPNFVAWYKEWNYRTFAEGATYIRLCCHHFGHRTAF